MATQIITKRPVDNMSRKKLLMDHMNHMKLSKSLQRSCSINIQKRVDSANRLKDQQTSVVLCHKGSATSRGLFQSDMKEKYDSNQEVAIHDEELNSEPFHAASARGIKHGSPF